MSKGLLLLCFIFALPALAIGGHDIYLAWLDMQQGKAEAFKFSDVGWLWQTYSLETFDWVEETLDKVTWVAFVDPLLEMTAFYVVAGSTLVIYALLIIFRLLKIWPFGNSPGLFSRQKKADFSFGSKATGSKKGPITYKRK